MIKTGKIRAVRERRGVTQEQMAETLGITQSAYAKVESGIRKIGAATLFNIAKILDEPMESFWEDSFNIIQHGATSLAAYNNKNYYAFPEEMVNMMKEELEKNREDRKAMLSLLERLAKK